jgi:hypothetical protein
MIDNQSYAQVEYIGTPKHIRAYRAIPLYDSVPRYGQVWAHEDGSKWIVMGTHTRQDGTLWCMSWTDCSTWYVRIKELITPLSEPLGGPTAWRWSLTDIEERCLWAIGKYEHSGAMWWCADLYEHGWYQEDYLTKREFFYADPKKAIAYYIAAIRKNPDSFEGCIDRVLSDGMSFFEPEPTPDIIRAAKRYVSRFAESHGKRSEDWREAIRIGDMARWIRLPSFQEEKISAEYSVGTLNV